MYLQLFGNFSYHKSKVDLSLHIYKILNLLYCLTQNTNHQWSNSYLDTAVPKISTGLPLAATIGKGGALRARPMLNFLGQCAIDQCQVRMT